MKPQNEIKIVRLVTGEELLCTVSSDLNKFIMFIVDPVETLKKQYQTMFAKILTPPSKILM